MNNIIINDDNQKENIWDDNILNTHIIRLTGNYNRYDDGETLQEESKNLLKKFLLLPERKNNIINIINPIKYIQEILEKYNILKKFIDNNNNQNINNYYNSFLSLLQKLEISEYHLYKLVFTKIYIKYEKKAIKNYLYFFNKYLYNIISILICISSYTLYKKTRAIYLK
jgi:hypothetical protein